MVESEQRYTPPKLSIPEPVASIGNIILSYCAGWIALIAVSTVSRTLLAGILVSPGDGAVHIGWLGVLLWVLLSGVAFAATLGLTRERKVQRFLPPEQMRVWWSASLASGVACWGLCWLLSGWIGSWNSEWSTAISMGADDNALLERTLLIGMVISTIGGAILGLTQWLVLRDYLSAASRMARKLAIRAAIVFAIPCAIQLWLFVVMAND